MSKFLEMYGSDEVVQEGCFGNYAYSNYEVVEEGVFSKIGNFIKELWTKLKNFFSRVWNWIKGLFSKNDKKVDEKAKEVKEEAKTNPDKALTDAKNIRFPVIDKDVFLEVDKLKNLIIVMNNLKPAPNATAEEMVKLVEEQIQKLSQFDNFKIVKRFEDQKNSTETNVDKVLNVATVRWDAYRKNVESLMATCDKYIKPAAQSVQDVLNENEEDWDPKNKAYYPRLKAFMQKAVSVFTKVINQIAALAPKEGSKDSKQ